ncbi:MAG TPA: hypothetical protein DCX06_14125 [Opitutae bacterium]|nr:hypothetical protein [Opitutae bacterium]
MTNLTPPQKRAKKAPSMTPIKVTGGHLVHVPASVSLTGKRQRLKFTTKREAGIEIERIKSMNRKWGTESAKLTAAQAEDAAQALSILSGHNITLAAVAEHWEQWKTDQDASCTFAELWKEYTVLKFQEVSDSYADSIKYYGEPILEKLGKVTVSELTTRQLEKALTGQFKTPRQLLNAKRTIRPAFSFAIRRGYASANPFDQMETTKLPQKEISAITIEQAKTAFNACADHRKDKKLKKSYRLDCSDCIPALAIMLFAGVRPKEIERLDWSAIHFDHEVITIGQGVAKTRSMRNIPIEPNLRTWLELTPKSQRQGSIVPLNWKEKVKAIRHIGGFSHLQDVLRHSFASYHLAAHADLNALQESMGHSTSEMILRHYKALVRKKDAVEFWSIRPDSTAPQIQATA